VHDEKVCLKIFVELYSFPILLETPCHSFVKSSISTSWSSFGIIGQFHCSREISRTMSENSTNAMTDSEVNDVKEVMDPVIAEDDTNPEMKTDETIGTKAVSTTVELPEELDESFIDTKVCKEFKKVPYIGEITGARMTKKGPLYKVIYRDGDEEEFSTPEAHEGKEMYMTLQTSMWNCMINLVEDLDVEKLRAAGINTISDLELFGGGAAKPTNSGTPFDSLDMPLKTKQQLYITATYLLNDQILTEDSRMDEMARFNLSKSNGTLKEFRRTTAGRSKKKSVIKAAATVKKADKPVARATKAAQKAAKAAREISAAATKSPSTKSRGRPKVPSSTDPTTNDSGPPADVLDGASD
jgi:hypothetical protein